MNPTPITYLTGLKSLKNIYVSYRCPIDTIDGTFDPKKILELQIGGNQRIHILTMFENLRFLSLNDIEERI
jgi:hypothetical protein